MEHKTVLDFCKSLLSRKLIVFLVATTLLVFAKINQETWVYIALGYMGLNTALRALEGYKTIKSNIIASKKNETEKEGEI